MFACPGHRVQVMQGTVLLVSSCPLPLFISLTPQFPVLVWGRAPATITLLRPLGPCPPSSSPGHQPQPFSAPFARTVHEISVQSRRRECPHTASGLCVMRRHSKFLCADRDENPYPDGWIESNPGLGGLTDFDPRVTRGHHYVLPVSVSVSVSLVLSLFMMCIHMYLPFLIILLCVNLIQDNKGSLTVQRLRLVCLAQLWEGRSEKRAGKSRFPYWCLY
jgi:hypothetical protein